MARDIYIISYGSKWGMKYKTGIVQKLFNTKDDALDYGRQKAKEFEGQLYIEVGYNKYEKVKG